MATTENTLQENAKVQLISYLRRHHMRCTPERLAILEKVFSTNAHFYVDVLHEALKLEGFNISLSTVYSTIQLFQEAGLVRRHQFGNQPSQYERVDMLQHENHHHLVCTECGRVRSVKNAELMKQIACLRYPTFKTEYFSLYIYGLCTRCQKRLKRMS